jgi:photosystem II stability/assembly factor-like uncharacterized protein
VNSTPETVLTNNDYSIVYHNPSLNSSFATITITSQGIIGLSWTSITIQRQIPVDQTTTYYSQTMFGPTTERALDKLTLEVQDLTTKAAQLATADTPGIVQPDNITTFVNEGLMSAPSVPGPQGPQGPQGPTGLQGPQGLPGEAALPIAGKAIDVDMPTPVFYKGNIPLLENEKLVGMGIFGVDSCIYAATTYSVYRINENFHGEWVKVWTVPYIEYVGYAYHITHICADINDKLVLSLQKIATDTGFFVWAYSLDGITWQTYTDTEYDNIHAVSNVFVGENNYIFLGDENNLSHLGTAWKVGNLNADAKKENIEGMERLSAGLYFVSPDFTTPYKYILFGNYNNGHTTIIAGNSFEDFSVLEVSDAAWPISSCSINPEIGTVLGASSNTRLVRFNIKAPDYEEVLVNYTVSTVCYIPKLGWFGSGGIHSLRSRDDGLTWEVLDDVDGYMDKCIALGSRVVFFSATTGNYYYSQRDFKISVQVDDVTITVNKNNQLEAIGGGGGFQYTAGNENITIDNTAHTISSKDTTYDAGTNISITDGTIAVSKTIPDPYTLPTATSTALGGVKVGTNLSITDGILSATDTTYDAGTNISITDGTIAVSKTIPDPYTLPTATSTALGGVKVGTNLSITDGTISVPTATTTTLGVVQPDGITTYTDSVGVLHASGGDGEERLLVGEVITAIDSDLSIGRSITTGSAAMYGVAYGDGRFVCVGSSGYAYYSTDGGVNWMLATTRPATSYSYYGVAYGDGRFVCVGTGSYAYYSTDGGVNWKLATTRPSSSYSYHGVAYGDGRFVCVGSSGSAYYSTDGGVTWIGKQYLDSLSYTYRGIVLGEDEKFVVVSATAPYLFLGKAGKSTRINITTTDPLLVQNGALTFSLNYLLSAQKPLILLGGNGVKLIRGSVLLQYLNNSTGFSDTYTCRGISSDPTGQNGIVCVGDNGNAYYSTDGGVNWMLATTKPSTSYSYYGVAYGDGRFVCVGSSGYAYYSTDGGVKWTVATTKPSTSYCLYGVAYGDGRFVCVGGSGSAYYSTDGGVKWTVAQKMDPYPSSTAMNTTIYSVCFYQGNWVCGLSSSINMYVLVSNSTTIELES